MVIFLFDPARFRGVSSLGVPLFSEVLCARMLVAPEQVGRGWVSHTLCSFH